MFKYSDTSEVDALSKFSVISLVPAETGEPNSVTPKTESVCSSEASAHSTTTRCRNPQEGYRLTDKEDPKKNKVIP
jgi:hypothetical protein